MAHSRSSPLMVLRFSRRHLSLALRGTCIQTCSVVWLCVARGGMLLPRSLAPLGFDKCRMSPGLQADTVSSGCTPVSVASTSRYALTNTAGQRHGWSCTFLTDTYCCSDAQNTALLPSQAGFHVVYLWRTGRPSCQVARVQQASMALTLSLPLSADNGSPCFTTG
eukprot:GHRR01033955.1.p1 GENE.GHRR01033955.1~~GHRR01033955.1.p1  ORF type:complete len:165 (+),score=15.37 GHRR01033955.1:564-1058(+)